MSKQRIIKDEMWDDEWFYDLDPSEKLVWVFLLTNPRSNIAGIYKLNFSWAATTLGFDASTLKLIILRFADQKKIVLQDNWVVIWNFHKHQSHNPKVEMGVVRIIEELPPEIRQLLPIDSLCIAYPTLLNSTLLNLSVGKTLVLHKKPLKGNKKDMAFKTYNENQHSDDLPSIGDDGEIEKLKEKPKRHYKEVYALFKKVLGIQPLDWAMNTTEQKSSDNLYTEYGLEQIEKALELYKENKDIEFCPQIYSPSTLIRKWKPLLEFKKKNNL